MYHSVMIKNLHTSSIFQDETSIKQLKQIHRQISLPIPNKSSQCILCYDKKISTYCKDYFTCHDNQLCPQCLIEYTQHCLLQNNNVKCLKTGCPGELKVQDKTILNIFPTSLRLKIDERRKASTLKNNKKCTRANCYGFINNGTCDLCLNNFCQQCYDLEHRGKCEKSEFPCGDSIKYHQNQKEYAQNAEKESRKMAAASIYNAYAANTTSAFIASNYGTAAITLPVGPDKHHGSLGLPKPSVEQQIDSNKLQNDRVHPQMNIEQMISPSTTSIQRSIILKFIIHKFWPSPDFLLLNRFWWWLRCLLNLWYIVLLLSRFLEIILSIVITLLPQLQLILNLRNQPRNLDNRYLIFSQDMRMLPIQLPRSLLRIRMEYQFLQQYRINLLFAVTWLLLIVNSNHRRLISYAESFFDKIIPRQTTPLSPIIQIQRKTHQLDIDFQLVMPYLNRARFTRALSWVCFAESWIISGIWNRRQSSSYRIPRVQVPYQLGCKARGATGRIRRGCLRGAILPRQSLLCWNSCSYFLPPSYLTLNYPVASLFELRSSCALLCPTKSCKQ